jgi:hypothetical protein
MPQPSLEGQRERNRGRGSFDPLRHRFAIVCWTRTSCGYMTDLP